MKFFIGLVAIGVLIIAANSYFFEPYRAEFATAHSKAPANPEGSSSASAQANARSQTSAAAAETKAQPNPNKEPKPELGKELSKELSKEPRPEEKRARGEQQDNQQAEAASRPAQASTDEQMPVIIPDTIGYETKEGASHKEFASKYKGYRSIAQNPSLAKAINGNFVGEVMAAEHSYTFELQVDAVIEGDSFMGQMSHKLISDGIVMAGYEGEGDIEDLTFNDAEEVIFTDIGGLPEPPNHSESSQSDTYYIYKISFANPDQPYLTLSRFDGTAIKNIGKGVMSRQ